MPTTPMNFILFLSFLFNQIWRKKTSKNEKEEEREAIRSLLSIFWICFSLNFLSSSVLPLENFTQKTLHSKETHFFQKPPKIIFVYFSNKNVAFTSATIVAVVIQWLNYDLCAMVHEKENVIKCKIKAIAAKYKLFRNKFHQNQQWLLLCVCVHVKQKNCSEQEQSEFLLGTLNGWGKKKKHRRKEGKRKW